MRIRWRNFELPSQVRLERETATRQYGRFIVEPFEKGFGTTSRTPRRSRRNTTGGESSAPTTTTGSEG